MVEEVHLPHTPSELVVYLTLYRNVQNSTFIRDQLLAGNSDFEYAFIDASVVISRKQILAATFRAINDYIHERLKSRNIHSEIVFALSPNNNIGEAFRRFGVQQSTKDIIVVKVATSPDVTLERVSTHLSASIQGEECRLDNDVLQGVSDVARIKKIYKLTGPNTGSSKSSRVPNGIASHPSDDRTSLETQILGLMALRGAT